MWPNPQETADMVKFTEEILNRKLHFLCSVQDFYQFITKLLMIKFYDQILLWFLFVNKP